MRKDLFQGTRRQILSCRAVANCTAKLAGKLPTPMCTTHALVLKKHAAPPYPTVHRARCESAVKLVSSDCHQQLRWFGGVRKSQACSPESSKYCQGAVQGQSGIDSHRLQNMWPGLRTIDDKLQKTYQQTTSSFLPDKLNAFVKPWYV